ncbi:putative General substrate transporter [Seiridium unicorne]|uniref:General substrate transporter n=1 Tax=Seiridium unicorne TaxID=138068 RepID=A0ABR2UZ07_9PEZI
MGKILVKVLRLVIRNDAMRIDPPQIYGWRVFALVCASCFGGMLFGWDIGAIGGILIMPKFLQDYGIGDNEKDILSENIVSTLQAGCFVASLTAAPVADKFGRRWSLILAAIITCLGIAIQAAPTLSLPVLYVGRLIAGFGVGAASMLTPLYVSECAPRAIRGALTGCYQLFIVNGVMLSFWVNYATQYHWADRNVYLIPLSLQAVPALCMLVGMLWCPESPRWTAKMDDWEKTADILSKLRSLPDDHEYIDHEMYGMAEQLEIERRLVGDATTWTLLKEMWLIRGNRNRALISMGLMVCQQMTGVNAINYYAPQMFQSLGMTSTGSSLFATGIYGVVKVVACLAFLIFAADSLGRRMSLLWTSIALSISMFIIGVYIYVSPPIEGQPIPPFGYVALVCIFLFAAFFQFGWGPCCWIYVSEIPSARLRAMNVAQAAATQWLFNFVVARTVPTMIKNMGYLGYGTYFLFGSFCASMFFFAYFLIPETKGMSLEKMDELFGITEMLRVIQDIDSQAAARRPYSYRTTAEYELKGEDQWQRNSSGGNSQGSAP